MKKETILSFSLGVIVGAAGMWALTPAQSTFEEGVIEYAPASTGEQVATPVPNDNTAAPAPSDNGMAAPDHMQQNPENTTSSNETTTAPADANAVTPAASNETPAQEAAPAEANTSEVAAPAPISFNCGEDKKEQEQAKLAAGPEEHEEDTPKEEQAKLAAGKKECNDDCDCDEANVA